MGKRPARKPFRKSENRPLRKIILIACEGSKSEPQYFKMFNSQENFTIKTFPHSTKSSPKHVLRRIREKIKKAGLHPDDQAWIVVDRDDWPEKDIDALYAWSQKSKQYGFALSNPDFEFWLLLHLEKVNPPFANCKHLLQRHIPDYDKGIKTDLFRDKVDQAVDQARARDNPPCKDWPRCPGVTTVYRLVEYIRSLEKKSNPAPSRG